jgi:hypothetical protein
VRGDLRAQVVDAVGSGPAPMTTIRFQTFWR